MPSKQALSKFKHLYFERYGKTLSDKEAFEHADGLLTLYKIMLNPTMKMKMRYGQKTKPSSNPE